MDEGEWQGKERLAAPAEEVVRLVPERLRRLSGSALKVIACVTMLIDHVAAHVLYYLPRYNVPAYDLLGMRLSAYQICRYIGRIAFPIYVFLLVEGFLHTRDRRRYGISLAAFAVISDVPWDLLHSGAAFSMESANVFYTLLFGYLALCAIEGLRESVGAMTLALVGLMAASLVMDTDYSIIGLGLIMAMYLLRRHWPARVMVAGGVLSTEFFALVAFVPIAFYNGKRGFVGKGPVLKYAFYAFYPAHLMVLWLIKTNMGL